MPGALQHCKHYINLKGIKLSCPKQNTRVQPSEHVLSQLFPIPGISYYSQGLENRRKRLGLSEPSGSEQGPYRAETWILEESVWASCCQSLLMNTMRLDLRVPKQNLETGTSASALVKCQYLNVLLKGLESKQYYLLHSHSLQPCILTLELFSLST